MIDINKKTFCVDSDGCAMDTMTFKHELFFGPLAADFFAIPDQEREAFLKDWNVNNLYSKTRGVNRFKGLLMSLKQYHVDNISNLEQWVETTSELSNDSLAKEIEKVGSDDLKKALAWSNEVNQKINAAKGLDAPFEGVKTSLEILSQNGNVVVVSSANKEAVQKEWSEHGLLSYVDELNCQDAGKKSEVIARLVTSGINPKNIIMVGDSPGDLDAAQDNNVYFYPILVNKEKQSWEDLVNKVLDSFVNNHYSEIQEQYIEAFWENLK